jgi:2-alkenal reductase
MSKKTIQKIIALIVIFVLLSACGLTSMLSQAAKEMRETVPTLEQVFEATPTAKSALQEPPASSFNPVVEDNQDLLEALYEHVSPGVVSIQGMSVRSGGSQGTGFVVDTQGHIVTNYHVVDGQDTIEVHFQSGLKSYASVVGKDIDSDLAVIKVDVDSSQLVPLVFGDSDLVKVGQTVAAIGNPYGLSGTMTVGVVSARGRILDSMRQSSSGGYFSSGDTIQTDALINPGNSGGPLLNLNGEVIGVNRAIQTSGISITGDAINTGIGFAISSNVARKVVPSLIEKGTFEYPYLGMTSLSNISLSLQEALDLPQSVGVYVSDVVQGGPADKAGLRGGTQPSQVQGYYKGGDLIIAVDGISVKDFSEMFNYIVINKNPGDVVVFTVIRDGQEMNINLTVEARR